MTFNRENFFDVKAIANVTMLIAPKEFSCELDIPEANYTARKEAIYYPGDPVGKCYSRLKILLCICANKYVEKSLWIQFTGYSVKSVTVIILKIRRLALQN